MLNDFLKRMVFFIFPVWAIKEVSGAQTQQDLDMIWEEYLTYIKPHRFVHWLFGYGLYTSVALISNLLYTIAYYEQQMILLNNIQAKLFEITLTFIADVAMLSILYFIVTGFGFGGFCLSFYVIKGPFLQPLVSYTVYLIYQAALILIFCYPLFSLASSLYGLTIYVNVCIRYAEVFTGKFLDP